MFRRWEPPLTREDGWPDVQVTALAWSRPDRTLWLALADGRMLALDPGSRRWTDEIQVGRRVGRIVPDERSSGDLLLGTDQGWLRLDPFSRSVGPSSAAEAAAAAERSPELRARREFLESAGFQSARAFLGAGPGGARYDVTDAMPSDDPARFWIATWGGGLVLYETFGGDWTRVETGLQGTGAGAIVLEPSGAAWIAPAIREGSRYGITRVSERLDEWRTESAFEVSGVPDDGVRALLVSGGDLWSAGERGLHHRSASGRWSRVELGSAAAERLLCLAGGTGREGPVLWIGGERGLWRVDPRSGSVQRPFDRAPVVGLHATGAGAWAATSAGLVWVPDGGAPVPADGVPPSPAGAVAGAADTVWAGIDREVWRFSPGGGWTRVEPVGRLSASVTALAERDGLLWVGSSEELVVWDRRGGLTRRFTFASGDLPAGPFGERGIRTIAPAGKERAWLALPAGALRFDAWF